MLEWVSLNLTTTKMMQNVYRIHLLSPSSSSNSTRSSCTTASKQRYLSFHLFELKSNKGLSQILPSRGLSTKTHSENVRLNSRIINSIIRNLIVRSSLLLFQQIREQLYDKIVGKYSSWIRIVEKVEDKGRGIIAKKSIPKGTVITQEVGIPTKLLTNYLQTRSTSSFVATGTICSNSK